MSVLSSDTHPDIERLQIDRQRRLANLLLGPELAARVFVPSPGEGI